MRLPCNIADEIFSDNDNFNGAILWENKLEKYLPFNKVICCVNETLVEISSELKQSIENIKIERPNLHENLILRPTSENISFENGCLTLNLGVTSCLRYQASKLA